VPFAAAKGKGFYGPISAILADQGFLEAVGRTLRTTGQARSGRTDAHAIIDASSKKKAIQLS
jgi:hypothetical protein